MCKLNNSQAIANYYKTWHKVDQLILLLYETLRVACCSSRGTRNSKFVWESWAEPKPTPPTFRKIQAGRQRKRFVDLEWVLYQTEFRSQESEFSWVFCMTGGWITGFKTPTKFSIWWSTMSGGSESSTRVILTPVSDSGAFSPFWLLNSSSRTYLHR